MNSERSNTLGDLSHPMLLVTSMPEDRSRSISPNSTSSTSTLELRGMKLFKAIGRRLSRQRQPYEDDSTDSERSSSSEGHSDSGSGNNSPDCMSSKESNDSSLRKVLNTLNLSTPERRSSDSNSDISTSSRKKSSTTSTPKKILRQPTTYTYVRGLSGLPTIRVPRSKACCSQTSCSCRCYSQFNR